MVGTILRVLQILKTYLGDILSVCNLPTRKALFFFLRVREGWNTDSAIRSLVREPRTPGSLLSIMRMLPACRAAGSEDGREVCGWDKQATQGHHNLCKEGQIILIMVSQ